MSTNISESSLLERLFQSGCHWGHKSSNRNPKNRQFIYTKNNGMDIIDLRHTVKACSKIKSVVEKMAENGGKIVLVGTKGFASALVKDYAVKASMPYVNRRWLGGTLTNFKTIKQSVKKLVYLESMIENNKFDNLTKKERLMQERKLRDLTANLGGLRDLNTLPDMLFVIDANHDKIAVQEANKLGIPVISIIDTNTSPEGISHGIPGNDDSMKAIDLYLEMITESILAGVAKIKPEMKLMQQKTAVTKKEAAKSESKILSKGAPDAAKAVKKTSKKRVVTINADTSTVDAPKTRAKSNEVPAKEEKANKKSIVKKEEK